MTPLEMKVIKAILESEYHDGRNPVGNSVWVDCLWDLKKEGLRKSGAMGSLVKKKYIDTDGESCSVTVEGYNAFLNAGGVFTNPYEDRYK